MGLKPEKALRLLHQMFGLFDEGIWDARIARAYKGAYGIATENEDESRARVFAERRYDARRLIEGDDSPVTMKMKRSVEELSSAQAPQGMSETQFENWLWMLDGVLESQVNAGFDDSRAALSTRARKDPKRVIIL